MIPSLYEKTALWSVVLDMEILIPNVIPVPILSTCNHLWIHLRHASQAAQRTTIQTHQLDNVIHVMMVAIYVLDQMLMNVHSDDLIGSLTMKEYVNVRLATTQYRSQFGIVWLV